MHQPPSFFQGADSLRRAKLGWTQRPKSDSKMPIGAQRQLRQIGDYRYMFKKP